MAKKTFGELYHEATSQDDYWVQSTALEFSTALFTEMKRQGKTKSELAAILGTSPAYITKIFSGNANFTVETMVKLSRALGCRLQLKLSPDPGTAGTAELPSSKGESDRIGSIAAEAALSYVPGKSEPK